MPCCACAKACGPSVELQLLFELAELLTRVILSLSFSASRLHAESRGRTWLTATSARDSRLLVGSERTDEQTTPRDWEKAEALYSSWNAQLSLTPRLDSKKAAREREKRFSILHFWQPVTVKEEEEEEAPQDGVQSLAYIYNITCAAVYVCISYKLRESRSCHGRKDIYFLRRQKHIWQLVSTRLKEEKKRGKVKKTNVAVPRLGQASLFSFSMLLTRHTVTATLRIVYWYANVLKKKRRI